MFVLHAESDECKLNVGFGNFECTGLCVSGTHSKIYLTHTSSG